MKHSGRAYIVLGLLLLAAALSLTGYNLLDSLRAGRAASQAVSRLEAVIPAQPQKKPAEKPTPGTAPAPESAPKEETEVPDYLLNPDMEMPVEEIDGVCYIGIVRIPALELDLPVISQWSYPNLKIAPCRYTGSAYLDDLVIAGHNYDSHFGPISRLSPGEAVLFIDMDGNRFRYAVASMETLLPAAIPEMTGSGYALTLFTCTPGGQSRIAIRCDRVTDSTP